MERLARILDFGELKRKTAGKAVVLRRDAGSLVSCAFLLLISMLLASYAPFEGISPFGAACVMAAWASGSDPYFACAGAVLGYMLSGSYTYAASTFVLGAAIALINRQGSIDRVFRLLISFAVQLAALTVISLFTKQRALFLAGALTVSVFASVVLACAIKAFSAISGSRRLGDAELLTLAAAAGLITLSMRNFNVIGASAAMIFAGVCSLFAAYRLGIPAVAFAVTVGAGRVLASGGDMHFIAVLAACTLAAASLRALGKWASLTGFAILGVLFALFVRGLYIFNYAELGIISAIFAAVPAKLYFPDGLREQLYSPGGSETKYGRLQYSVATIGEALEGIAPFLGVREGAMIGTVSDSLKNALKSKPKKIRYRVEFGSAGSAGGISEVTGDSCSFSELEGEFLAALSDGMGSGDAAGRESENLLDLFSRLIDIGFDIGSAAEYVNELLSEYSDGDIYATLEAIRIDLSSGSAKLIKHGAPESFVLRDGSIYTLYGEGLPMGIVDNAAGYVSSFKLLPGDAVVMMTDGVSEALGSSLITAIANNVLEFGDAEMAANSLLDAAAERGSDDDMTVIVIRFEAA